MLRTLCFSLLTFLAAAQPGQVLQSWIDDPELKNASYAFSVMDAVTGSVITEYNSKVALVPASTLKVLTTSAALSWLGATFRYDTRLIHSGTFDRESGILIGDVYIRGSGDPTMQSNVFVNERKEVITDAWARALKEKGFKEIRGAVIGDASVFERMVPDHWIWSDISNYFGATPCGLSFMDNKYNLFFTTGAVGSSATITSIFPESMAKRLIISSSVTAGGTEDAAFIYGDPFSYTKRIRGTIPPDSKDFQVEGTLPDPALLCAEYFTASLEKEGIHVQNGAASKYTRNDSLVRLKLIYTHSSPRMERIVHHTNLRSNNHYCESLLTTLGAGSREKGIETVNKFWTKKGLNTEGLYMVDGSGLSRANTVTTGLMTDALCRIYADSSLYRVINGSFSVAGKAGTLRNLGKGTEIEGKLRAKTGYILRARSYCGYITSASGRELAFTIIFNNYNCTPVAARQKMETFLIALGKLQ